MPAVSSRIGSKLLSGEFTRAAGPVRLKVDSLVCGVDGGRRAKRTVRSVSPETEAVLVMHP